MASVTASLVATGALVVQAFALGAVLAALARDPRAGLAPLAWLVGATAVRALANGLGELITTRLAAPVRRALRRRALAVVLDRGRESGAEATAHLLTRGLDELETFLSTYVPALALALVAPVGVALVIGAEDWLSGVIVAVSALVLPVFMILLGLAARDEMDRRWRDQQRLATYVGDVVRGMRDLKSLNRSRDAVRSLDDAGEALTRSTMATLRVAFLSTFALELLSSLATALVALSLGLRLIHGGLSLERALVVLLLTPEVFAPLRRAAARYHDGTVGMSAAGDVLDLVERARPSGERPAPGAPPAITFASLRARPGLAAVDAVVAPGGRLTVRGPSGAGKTSLLRVLAGLADPHEGAVLIDGAPLARIDADAWRARVGWLDQDPTLRGVTTRDALTRGATASDAVLRDLLDDLGLDLALDEPLAGLELSAGERRRLALAGALVRDPLVLVLDEPTAHLDPGSAARVRAVIARSRATVIVAAHESVVEGPEVAVG